MTVQIRRISSVLSTVGSTPAGLFLLTLALAQSKGRLSDADEARHEYDIRLHPNALTDGPYDLILGAVAHDNFKSMSVDALVQAIMPNGIVADLKGMWRKHQWPAGLAYWQV